MKNFEILLNDKRSVNSILIKADNYKKEYTSDGILKGVSFYVTQNEGHHEIAFFTSFKAIIDPDFLI